MKYVLTSIILAGAAWGQPPPAIGGGARAGQHPIEQITPPSQLTPEQRAQDVTVHLNAEQATILEKFRRDTYRCVTNGNTGGVTCAPVLGTLQELVDALLKGAMRPLVAKYPPASIAEAQKAAQDATDKASKAGDKVLGIAK